MAYTRQFGSWLAAQSFPKQLAVVAVALAGLAAFGIGTSGIGYIVLAALIVIDFYFDR